MRVWHGSCILEIPRNNKGKKAMEATKDLEKRALELEFQNDQLQAEIEYLDKILRGIGFVNGLASAKEVAEYMVEEGCC